MIGRMRRDHLLRGWLLLHRSAAARCCRAGICAFGCVPTSIRAFCSCAARSSSGTRRSNPFRAGALRRATLARALRRGARNWGRIVTARWHRVLTVLVSIAADSEAKQ